MEILRVFVISNFRYKICARYIVSGRLPVWFIKVIHDASVTFDESIFFRVWWAVNNLWTVESSMEKKFRWWNTNSDPMVFSAPIGLFNVASSSRTSKMYNFTYEVKSRKCISSDWRRDHRSESRWTTETRNNASRVISVGDRTAGGSAMVGRRWGSSRPAFRAFDRFRRTRTGCKRPGGALDSRSVISAARWNTPWPLPSFTSCNRDTLQLLSVITGFFSESTIFVNFFESREQWFHFIDHQHFQDVIQGNQWYQ